jgi:hypothetical protein
MKELMRRLSRKVQTLWNKIFGKEKSAAENTVHKCSLGPGEIFIDGKPFG